MSFGARGGAEPLGLGAREGAERLRCPTLGGPGEVPERLNGRDWKSRNGG
jgi:hypothetical protein